MLARMRLRRRAQVASTAGSVRSVSDTSAGADAVARSTTKRGAALKALDQLAVICGSDKQTPNGSYQRRQRSCRVRQRRRRGFIGGTRLLPSARWFWGSRPPTEGGWSATVAEALAAQFFLGGGSTQPFNDHTKEKEKHYQHVHHFHFFIFVIFMILQGCPLYGTVHNATESLMTALVSTTCIRRLCSLV